MTTEESLDKAIYDAYRIGKKPHIIVLHPDAWVGKGGFYKGYKVLRSPDVATNEIIVA